MKIRALKEFVPQKNERVKDINTIPEGYVFIVPEARGRKLIELGICVEDKSKPRAAPNKRK